MAQPIKNDITKPKPKKKVKRRMTKSEYIKKQIERSQKPHPKYGTSKLEERFAKNYLDKLGVEYERQFEAKDIKRFYDFAIRTPLGHIILIEVDGDYFHGYDKLYEEKNPMQKRNERVDKIKDEWARAHGYRLVRIWEHDINNNSAKVTKILKEALGDAAKDDDKKRRH